MVRELITKLGGVSAVSKRLNITRQSIYYWIDMDRIPEALRSASRTFTGYPWRK